MQKARCGNPDLGTYDSIGRPVNVDIPESLSSNNQGRSRKNKTSESSATNTYSWPKKNLKWFIEEYPKQQKYIKTDDHIRDIINQAFYDWEKYSGLKFEMAKTKNTADLKIKFRSNDHGDGYPFDGQGATLAHAFYPTTGDIHFDDDEYFTDNYENKGEEYTLRLVAAHEIGHALGLSHSFDEGSLMYPIYQPFNRSFELTNDDQRSIQEIYGKPEIKTTTEQSKITFSPKMASTISYNILPNDNWCSGEFQTGCEGPDGELYLFRDNQVWRYQALKKRSWDPEPTLISERFPPLTDSRITACVKSSMGYTYLFRNYGIWKLKTHWAVDGPHILHGKHYPQNPRVALLHQNSIYLIRNRLIYRFNEFNYDGELEIRTIDTILNPPPNEFIQSGFTYDKRHYIFTKRYVYVYDSTHGSLLPGYPRPATNGWFACESASQVQKWTKKMTTTIRPLPTKSFQKHNHDEDEDEHHFHHHHHHHHHHRPRRPFYHHHHHRRPLPPPHEYRRRWED
jgi:predicted Zn-dependent protease